MRPPPKASSRPSRRLREYGLATGAVAAAIALCFALREMLPVASLALVFVCAVLAVALLTRTAVAAFAALLSFLGYNFFFTAPHYTLLIRSPSDVAAVSTFLLAALTVGHLAARQRAQLVELRLANDRIRALQRLGQQLAAAVDERGVFERACAVADDALGGTTAVVTLDGPDAPLAVHSAPGKPPVELSEHDEELVRAVAVGNAPGGAGGEDVDASPWWFLALPADGARCGAIGFRFADPEDRRSLEATALAQAIAHQTAEAAHRTRLVARLAEARMAGETERLRTALLASVSHDLRSPLASILGAASTLSVYGAGMAEADRRSLVDAIREESERLDRHIQNLLDMTRLGAGPLTLRRDWVGLEEIVASARARLGRSHPRIPVEVAIPPGLPALFVHAALIEQALYNVLDNAARYTPPGERIRVRAHVEGATLVLEVVDRGPGIPALQRERVFDLFYTTARGDGGPGGSGLGLTIVRGMLRAHGGEVAADAGEDGVGTTVRMTLPLVEPPRSPEEDEA